MTTGINIPLLPLASSGCACCTPEAAASDEGVADASSPSATYGMIGLKCGSCASRVAASIKKIDGVLDAQVSAVPGGISTAVVTSTRPIADASIAEAVARAGYGLAATVSDNEQSPAGCCSD